MTLSECYELLGADYEGTISRIGEARAIKFIPKLLDDPTYDELASAFERQDWETAFRSAHTMKGFCANFGLTKLQTSSSNLCEALRPGVYRPQATPLFEEVKRDYARMKEVLSLLQV